MAFWTGSIKDINEGYAANDGSGDSIRSAFFKVDENFQEINNFLGNTTIDFVTANVSTQFRATNATIGNLTSTNLVSTTITATGNITAGNLIANTGIYSAGPTHLVGNLTVAGNIIPMGSGQYDLGSITNPFRNLYYVSAISGGVATTTDAGLLVVHANAAPGDNKDVGIFGNITHSYSSNTYSFFGYQKKTNNFVYKITNNNDADPILGNSVVYGGIYGNVQFGSGFLSNTTASTNSSTGALIVAGGAGIGGNLNVAGVTRLTGNTYITGTAFANGGYEVITTSIIGNYGAPYTGGIISGNTVFLSASVSTSANTGAVVIPYGGLGVYGNVNAGGLVGPYYGTVMTAAQPNITSVGTLPTLNAGTINATSMGITNITATGNVNVSTINGLVGLIVTGNTTSTGFVGTNFYGTMATAAQPNITSTGALTAPTLSTPGSITVGNSFMNTSSTNLITSNTTTLLDTFSSTVYGSAKYIVQLVDTGYTPSRVQTTEVMIVHDRNGANTVPYLNAYGSIYNTVGPMGIFSTSYVSGNVQLNFTTSYAPTSLRIKVAKTAIAL